MNVLRLALLAGFISPAMGFAADTYAIDGAHTYPSFEVNHLGFSTTHGRFDKTSGTIVLDIAGKKGSIEAVIDTTSLSTGYEMRDGHLKGPGFFNVATFPTATVKADQFTFDGNKLVAAKGTLTLLGVTQPITLTVKSFLCDEKKCGADVETNIKRSDFGMKTFLPKIGDDVKISVQIEASKQ